MPREALFLRHFCGKELSQIGAGPSGEVWIACNREGYHPVLAVK
jgi:hypothetical protein